MVNIEPKQKKKSRWFFIITVLAVLALLSYIFAGFVNLFVGEDDLSEGNVALIPLIGPIYGDSGGSIFEKGVASSSDTVELIKKADENPNIKAIMLEINSPGGGAVASEEVMKALKKVNKTKVAWIRETGASGAYWAASACDVIVASPLSVTGSIGVTSSYIEFAGLLERYNMTYQELTSGELKDVGSPLRKLEPKEKDIIREKIKIIHEYFIKSVAENRGMNIEDVRKASTGIFYLGEEAKELGLVDVLGGEEEAVGYIEKELNITAEVVTYEKQKTLLDVLGALYSEQSFKMGQGIGDALVNQRADNKVEIRT